MSPNEKPALRINRIAKISPASKIHLMKPFRTLLLGAGVLMCVVQFSLAQNWANWRGPSFNGSTTAKNLPAEFSPTNNVKWVADLPGPSAATPIVWNDHIFLSSTDTRTRTLRALALERKTGKLRWNHEVAQGFSQDNRSNLASPSPVTDGERVIFFYGTGDLVAYDFSGEKLWARNLQQDYGQFAFLWTFSTSPLLHDGVLYMQVLQRDVPVNGRGRTDGPNDSYLLALDPKTGKELWKQLRPCEARAESREAFSTPIPFTHGGRAEILVAGGDTITGHDPKNGAELWRWATWNPTSITHWRLVPSPVPAGDIVIVPAPKGAPIYAFKLGGKGTLDDSAIAWTSPEREVSSDVSTPAFHDGRFYVLNSDRKHLSRVDPATGKADWIGDLGTRIKLEASPTIADGKIYMQNFKGEVFVAAAGPEFKILHVAAMGDSGDNDTRSSIAIAHDQLFIRTASKLFCVGN
jgi:outer membrane protein assembly factor BamB